MVLALGKFGFSLVSTRSQLWFSNGKFSVGISGHFAHGGFGFSSHMHGLALDSVVGVTVVLADGRVVDASETRNADLFWAIKGAGSNFGIVAEWKLATFEAPTVLTKLSVQMNWNKSTAVAGLEAVEKFAKNVAPRELNFRLGAYAGNSIGFEGLYYGPPAEALAVIAPLLAVAAPNANITEADEMPWLEAVNKYSYSPAIDMITPSPVGSMSCPDPVMTQIANYQCSKRTSTPSPSP
jgi:FAD/FMN-containing dehydrogenase